MGKRCMKDDCLSCFVESGQLRQVLEYSRVSHAIIDKLITRCR